MPRQLIASDMMNRVLDLVEQNGFAILESKIRVSFTEEIDPDNLWLEASIGYNNENSRFHVCLMVGDGTLHNERVVHLRDLVRNDIANTVNSWLETEFGLMFSDVNKTVSGIEIIEYDLTR